MEAVAAVAGLFGLFALGISLVCHTTFLVALGWGLIVFVVAFIALIAVDS